MKTRLLSLVMLGLALQGFSQNNLKTLIRGENGTTKHFVKLAQDQQLPFNTLQAAKMLGLSDKSSLVLKSTEKDNLGFVHYRFQQTYQGTPVNHSMYIVNTKNGKVVSLSGTIITDFNESATATSAAKISPAQAIAYALRNVAATKYMWQDKGMEAALKAQFKNSSATYYPAAEKCWFSEVGSINPADLKLAYKIDVYAAEPYSRAYYYIDAATGNLLGREERIHTADVTGTANTLYSGTQTIHSEQTGANAYRLHDLSRGNGVITLRVGGDDFTSTSANWNLSLPDQNALDAHWGVEMTYDFYKEIFNRNSIDNNGYTLYSYVNRKSILYRDNASWSGTAMNYGIRSGSSQKGVTGIDVTGHELTHGVTQYTSGLVYQNESGAMNESMSDIMGKSVQFWAKPNDIDWRLSNDMNWFIRDKSNPNAYQQPDTYKGTYWANGGSDNGGVHTNSGVGNFMYYLLVTGGSGTNDNGDAYNVQGIGIEKAEQIIYRTETAYLTSTSVYADWREASVNAAIDLYGASSSEVAQVKNAWNAVGVYGEDEPAYCVSKGLSTANEYINLVNFNGSDYVSGDNGGYGDFTSVISDVVAGQKATIQVRAGFPGVVRKEGWTMYIDYNGDGDFSDAGEKVGSATVKSAAILTKSFRVPASAKVGLTRMRIQMHYNTAISDPCATFDQGEVEDYSVNITAGGGATETLISDISVYPNPVVSSSVKLNYTLVNSGKVTFRLADAMGVSKNSYEAGVQTKGKNNFTLNNLSALHNGYYYVAVEQDGVVIGKITLLVAH